MRKIPYGVPDLVGQVSGWLTVIGLAVHRAGGGGGNGHTSRWVCRCACGYYVIRTSASIRRGVAKKGGHFYHADRCDRCRQVAYLQRRSLFEQIGFNPDEGIS
jgi:hypothetical protein